MATLAAWTYGDEAPPAGPVQTDFTPGSGNALQSCVAALLGLPLADVPNFVTLDIGYEQGIRDFVAPRTVRKVGLSDATLECLQQSDAGAVVLLRGGSPRGDHGHVVLARLKSGGASPFEMAFDPHPDGSFLAPPPYGWAMLIGEPPPPALSLAFIFPLMSGCLNPALPVARTLVERGHRVHFLCFEAFRAPIEDTGAAFTDAAAAEPELYATREPTLFGAVEALSREHGVGGGDYTARCCLANVQLALQLPGVLRWLAARRPSVVVYDPIINREAAIAARLLDLPAVALLTFAGPGGWEETVATKLRTERKSAVQLDEEVKACAANLEAIAGLRAAYGLCLTPRQHGQSAVFGELDPIPRRCLVTTTRALAAPETAPLRAAHAAARAAYVYVGPLLDAVGAPRAGGFKVGAAAGAPAAAAAESAVAAAARVGEGAEEAEEAEDPLMARVRAARAAGRRVVLASMGTVATGDHASLGWRGTPREGGGLSGAALCRAAWGGLFDALGAADAADAPLLVVSLGPQPGALGPLAPPPNAACAPFVPQVDVLRLGVAAFLTHGGQNSFMEALSQATPLLVCPTAGDQFDNARLCARLGVGAWCDRPDPDAGGEEEAAAAYRAEVAGKMRELLHASGGARFKEQARAQADALASAGGVPRAADVVVAAATPGVNATVELEAP